MEKSKTLVISAEPFEEPSSFTKIFDYVSYLTKTNEEAENVEEKIDWMKFVIFSEVPDSAEPCGDGIIVGRHDVVEVYQFQEPGRLLRLYADHKVGVPWQTAALIPRGGPSTSRAGSGDSSSGPVLVGACGSRLLFSSLLPMVPSFAPREVPVSGGVSQIEVSSRLVAVLLGGCSAVLLDPTSLALLAKLDSARLLAIGLAWVGYTVSNTAVELAHVSAGILTSIGRTSAPSAVSQLHIVPGRAGTHLLLVALQDGSALLVYRVLPQVPSGGRLLLLYRLQRGHTACPLKALAVSPDARLIAAASARGTVHLWPVCGLGGPVSARLLCSAHVVNRLSRPQRTAGLLEHHVTRPPGVAASSAVGMDPVPLTLTSVAKIHTGPPDQMSALSLSFRHSGLQTGLAPHHRTESLLIHRPGPLSQPSLIQYSVVVHPPADKVDLDSASPCLSPYPNHCWRLLLRPASPPAAVSAAPSPGLAHSTTSPSPTPVSATPRFWYAHIEVSAQIVPAARCIRKLDKFTLSTYQTKEAEPVSLQAVGHQPNSRGSRSSSTSSSASVAEVTTTTPSSSGGSAPVRCTSEAVSVPHSLLENELSGRQNRVVICNSFCGSSVGMSSGGGGQLLVGPGGDKEDLLQSAVRDYVSSSVSPAHSDSVSSLASDYEGGWPQLGHTQSLRRRRRVSGSSVDRSPS